MTSHDTVTICCSTIISDNTHCEKSQLHDNQKDQSESVKTERYTGKGFTSELFTQWNMNDQHRNQWKHS